MTHTVNGPKRKSTSRPLVELARLALKTSRSTRAQERILIVTAGRGSMVIHRKRKAVMESQAGNAATEMHMD